MLHLTKNLLHKAKNALEHGAPRSTAISAVAGGVGLAAGKREDARKVPVAAMIGGAALKLFGFHTLGDGALAGGATILGYRTGARMARKQAAPQLPAGPAARPAVAQRHGKHRR